MTVSLSWDELALSIDIEITNRCNAKCHFCPRDRTPHQGLIDPATFAKALERAVEYREVTRSKLGKDIGISICGLGEPLLHRQAAEFVGMARAEGFKVTLSTNASLLDERRTRELLDVGLDDIYINVGEEGDDYEEVYQLPFERTLENVVRFNEASAGACRIVAVIVDHRQDPDHVARMERYWSDHGITHSGSYQIMNRGGSLFVDHMQYETYDELLKAKMGLSDRVGTPLCGAPFFYLFIGYDGQYYMCCSDWEKQAPLGSVFELSMLDVSKRKLEHLASREPVCKTCNLDPVNKLTEELRAEQLGAVPAGTSAALLEALVEGNRMVEDVVSRLGFDVPPPSDTPRRLIPVRGN
jgi:MoaA/NifB/PqqE/SkfB family radical SAM enzyme